jgi:hypothetical protein
VVGSPFTAVTSSPGLFDQSGVYLFTHPGSTLSVANVNTTTGALSSIGSPITGLAPSADFAVTDPH